MAKLLKAPLDGICQDFDSVPLTYFKTSYLILLQIK